MVPASSAARRGLPDPAPLTSVTDADDPQPVAPDTSGTAIPDTSGTAVPAWSVADPEPAASDADLAAPPDPARAAEIRRMMLMYRFGIEAVETRVRVLREELRDLHEDTPIEHVGSRLKSFPSLVAKARRKGVPLEFDQLRDRIQDIAGVRITCAFVTDIYRVRDMLLAQPDLALVREVDYIAHPKANGYKSLHLIVLVPVFLSDRVAEVPVEIQLRTIAMDFWASLEHKIHYKYDHAVPQHITDALKLAADVAATLDTSMERIRDEVVAGTPDTD